MEAYALGATLWALVFQKSPVDIHLVETAKISPMPEMYR